MLSFFLLGKNIKGNGGRAAAGRPEVSKEQLSTPVESSKYIILNVFFLLVIPATEPESSSNIFLFSFFIRFL